MYNLLTLLKHWELILTYRHCCCTKCGNICRLTDRIAEETNRNAGLEISHLNLSFYSWIPLYTGYRNQIHIIKSQLCQFRNHGLDKDRGFLRINSTCQIVKRHVHNILAHLLRMLRIISQRLCVCDHNINFIIISGILEFYSFF